MTQTDNPYYSQHAQRLHEEWLKEKTPSDLMPFLELLEPGARILDLGCGNGIDLVWMVRAGFQGSGMDASSAMIERARVIHAHSGVEILHRNFLFLDFPSGKWDAVWSNLSFCEIPPEALQRVLAICFKGMKVGAKLGAVMIEGSGSNQEGTEESTRTIYQYTEKALCSLFEQTGFQVKKIGRKASASGLSKLLIIAERV